MDTQKQLNVPLEHLADHGVHGEDDQQRELGRAEETSVSCLKDLSPWDVDGSVCR